MNLKSIIFTLSSDERFFLRSKFCLMMKNVREKFDIFSSSFSRELLIR